MFSCRLIHVYEGNFRNSDVTLFGTVPKSVRNSMKYNDAVCFVNKRGTQIMFIYRFEDDVVASSRIRLLRRSWNPNRLRVYAKKVGINIINLDLLDEHLNGEEVKHAKPKNRRQVRVRRHRTHRRTPARKAA